MSWSCQYSRFAFRQTKNCILFFAFAFSERQSFSSLAGGVWGITGTPDARKRSNADKTETRGRMFMRPPFPMGIARWARNLPTIMVTDTPMQRFPFGLEEGKTGDMEPCLLNLS